MGARVTGAVLAEVPAGGPRRRFPGPVLLGLVLGISRDGVVMAAGMFRTLTPFAVYCLMLGLGSILYPEVIK